ncbi:hypothetical protein RUND412_002466 [Rhizina undulata]
MAQVEQLLRSALRCDKELATILREQPVGRTLEHATTQLREAYENIVFVDLEYALECDVEGRIWTNNYKVIERYRKILNQFRDTNGKKKPVEHRKLQTSFVNFIKQTTRFYRSFIQKLVAYYGVYELEWVVRKFNLSTSAPATSSAYGPEIKALVIRSCHRTLVYLGDLSRYRELLHSPKDWGPATGYYTLAGKLIPFSGTPHNQLAVIAASEGSSLSYTYHLYRALSVAEPFPGAGDNLAIGFRKVLKTHKAGSVGNMTRKEEQVVVELVSLFVSLHAKCFRGKEFSEHEALESEMLTQLALDLKERTLSNGMLSKFVLINIAAQSYAAQKLKEPGFSHAYRNFFRLNVLTFTTLHQVFQPELERVVGGNTENDAENVSAVGRRMLPSLRLYSTWLRIYHQKLTHQFADTSMSVLIKQLWQTYANTLSLLAATFPIERLPKLDYLLEEDEDTMGFLPFVSVNGDKKASWDNEERGEREHVHPNEEMLARIRFLLEDGAQLCEKEDVPITMIDGTITYQEDGILTSTPSIGMNSLYHSPYDRVNSPDISDNPRGTYPPIGISNSPGYYGDAALKSESVLAQGGTSIVESATESETMTTAMNRMVDSLVGPSDEPVSDDEEILFSGRRRKPSPFPPKPEPISNLSEKSLSNSRIRIPSKNGDIVNVGDSSKATYTAKDLANLVQTFAQQSHSVSLPHIPTQKSAIIPESCTGHDDSSLVQTKVYHVSDSPKFASSMQAPSSFFYPPTTEGKFGDMPSPLFYGGRHWANTVSPAGVSADSTEWAGFGSL